MTVNRLASELGVVLLIWASCLKGSLGLSQSPRSWSEGNGSRQRSHSQNAQTDCQKGPAYGVTSRLIPLDRAVIFGW